MNNCPNCGSKIVFGGPRCCDGGASKREREKARRDALETRLALIEERLAALETGNRGVKWYAADKQEGAVATVLEQAEQVCRDWAEHAPELSPTPTTSLNLSAAELERVVELLENPPPPTQALKDALARRREG